MKRLSRRVLTITNVALLLLFVWQSSGAEPAAELLPNFVPELEDANTLQAQDGIMRAARLPLSGEQIRRLLLKEAYQRMIDGDYRRAQNLNDLVFRLANAAGAGENAAAAEVQNAYLFGRKATSPARSTLSARRSPIMNLIRARSAD